MAFLFLSSSAIGLAVSAAARADDWGLLLARWQALVVLPVWASGAWLVRRALRRGRRIRDPFLLPVAFLLTGWGLLAVWRVSPDFGARQTIWFILAVVALVEILPRPGILLWIRRYRYLLLTAGIALAALTLVFGTNPSGGEPRLWLGCCGVYFQPSEPLRLLLLAYFASYLADRMALSQRSEAAPPLATLAPLLVLWGLSVALLAVQRDLGTGTLFLGLLALLLYFASGQARVLVGAGALMLLGGALGYLAFEVVRTRMSVWLNPWSDPAGSAYQIVQGMISMASGGVLGRGPGMGAPGFVPVAHTDFVFAAVTEEWGLAGGLAMIGLYMVLVSRGLRVAAGSRDRFTSLLSAGIALAFGLQAILILGGVLRLLPLTGVTMPFVSYGGSSLVTSFVGLGLLVLLSSQGSSASAFRRPIREVHSLLFLAWIGLALSLGWWTVVRASGLTARTDNPRRGVAEFYSLRGAIVDREGEVLAHSVGDRGDYARSYPQPSAYSLVGFDSFRYGQAGVEEAMDPALRGEAGQDAWLIWWSHILTGTPPPGMDIRLTVSLDLQDTAAQALGDRPGAVVVLDAATGNISAMASSPTYDSNQIEEDWSLLVNRPDAPLINRATQGRYQPGGALAPLVLAWAIREDLAAPADHAPSLSTPLTFEGRSLTCVQIPELAMASYVDALANGCPRPFAELGDRIGIERLAEMLEAFGLARDPGLGLHGAGPYALPRDEDPGLAAAGQGSLTVSPVQLARAFAALVNNGFLPPVRLFDAQRVPRGDWTEISPEAPSSAAISLDEAAAVAESLPLLASGARGLAARAAVGEPGDFVAWFLGFHGGRVIVVVLEDGSPAEAEETGMAVLLDGNPFP